MTRSLRLAVVASTTAAASAPPASAAGLDAFLWKARPVLVFASDRNAPGAAEQLNRLSAARVALAERDMPVLVVTARSVDAALGGPAPRTIEADGLRRTYGVGPREFVVILVGKDGGEKLRFSKPVGPEKLIDVVDEMPMRRREAR